MIPAKSDRWADADGVPARDRLDVLGRDATGRLVVVELKRGTADREVHLQAITYADDQRGTPALRQVVESLAVALAAPAAARLLTVLRQVLSPATVLNCLMRITLPQRPTPLVAGRRVRSAQGHRYPLITIDAENGQRVEVLPDRAAATVARLVLGQVRPAPARGQTRGHHARAPATGPRTP